MVRCFVCSASTELQSWCMFSCFITLLSNCLQIHRISYSLKSRANEFATVLWTSILCSSTRFISLTHSILSSPLFPSPPLGSHLLPYRLVDNVLWLVGNNGLVTSVSGLTCQLAVPWRNARWVSYNCPPEFCASLQLLVFQNFTGISCLVTLPLCRI